MRTLMRRMFAALRSTRSILAASAVLAVATLASKVTGFMRIQAIADVFGASWQTDAFLTAFLIPECLYLFFTEGALSSVLVPVFASALAKEDERRDPGASRLLLTLCLGALVLGLPLAALIADRRMAVAAALAPGFATQTRHLAGVLLAIVAGYVPLGLVGGVLQGYLNARGHFLAPALGPLLFNVVTVAAAWGLGHSHGIEALAWAVLGGGLGALALQVVALILLRTPLALRPSLRDPCLYEAGRLLLPVAASVVLVQGQVVIERVVASSLEAGSVASLNFASKILNLPAGLLALTVATALLPTLAAAASRGAWDEADEAAATSHRTLLFLVAPASAWLVVTARPLVRLALERGAFSAGDTAATATVLAWFAPALLPLAGGYLLTRVFFARHDTATPSVVRMASVIVNALLLLTLLPLAGIVAIPAAATAMHLGFYVALLVVLARRSPVAARGFASEAGRVAVACVVAGVPAWLLTPAAGVTLPERVLAVLVPGLVIAVVYPLAALALGARSAADARALLGRLRRRAA